MVFPLAMANMMGPEALVLPHRRLVIRQQPPSASPPLSFGLHTHRFPSLVRLYRTPFKPAPTVRILEDNIPATVPSLVILTSTATSGFFAPEYERHALPLIRSPWFQK